MRIIETITIKNKKMKIKLEKPLNLQELIDALIVTFSLEYNKVEYVLRERLCFVRAVNDIDPEGRERRYVYYCLHIFEENGYIKRVVIDDYSKDIGDDKFRYHSESHGIHTFPDAVKRLLGEMACK